MKQSDRYFFHSFPRRRADESEESLFARGIAILRYIAEIGLVLAPEVVRWDTSKVNPAKPFIELLQRRVSFTELSLNELPGHVEVFGPFTLVLSIEALRRLGAAPVFYIPQHSDGNPLSLLPIFAMNSLYHTKAVLGQLRGLQNFSDPAYMEAMLGLPAAPNMMMNLKNNSGDQIVNDFQLPASNVRQLLEHVGFNNIPFLKTHVFDAADFVIRSNGVCRLNPELARHLVKLLS